MLFEKDFDENYESHNNVIPYPANKDLYPCKVEIKIYSQGKVKSFHPKEFNCQYCNGTSHYIIYNDSVKFEYHP